VTQLGDGQAALLRVLARHGVEFVVVGGVAAQLHGWRSATIDLDIAVERGESNAHRLNSALAALGVSPKDVRVGGFGTTFATRHGRLEVVRRADGIGYYADWLAAAGEVTLEEGLTIVVAAPGDILRSKEAAGRDKDLAALDQMRRDFEESGAL
jgi:hypothetical protein